MQSEALPPFLRILCCWASATVLFFLDAFEQLSIILFLPFCCCSVLDFAYFGSNYLPKYVILVWFR